MTLANANAPTLETIATHSDQLRRRLRAIKRFRRQSLNGRALRLESLLTEILLGVSTAAGPPPISTSHHRSSKNDGISHEEHQRLLTLLDHTRKEYDALIDFIDSERAGLRSLNQVKIESDHIWQEKISTESDTIIPRPLSSDIGILHNQIEFLEQELEAANKTTHDGDAERKTLREQIEVLRTQLLESRHETIELRIQNSDLRDKAGQGGANLTWEQVKEQLLHELESEPSDDPEVCEQRLQLTEVIESTQREIDRRDEQLRDRDREIDELKMLLTRQSSVTNGMAVGAAAVAHLMDADELLQEEREKVRRLQHEWEEKLRNAEIEISLERARMSRERLEFESSMLAQPTSPANSELNEPCQRSEQEPLGRPRRWLRRLGLREE